MTLFAGYDSFSPEVKIESNDALCQAMIGEGSMPASNSSMLFLKVIKDPHIKTLAKELLSLGFELKRSRNHLVFAQGSATICLPKTPSDHRTWLNQLVTIKRHTGIDFKYLFKK